MQEWIALTGLDNHSVSINPAFVSTTDLNTSAALLNGRGTPVSGIDYDIEGISRDPVTPLNLIIRFSMPETIRYFVTTKKTDNMAEAMYMILVTGMTLIYGQMVPTHLLLSLTAWAMILGIFIIR